MMFFSILGSLAAIGALCWLLFALAIYALPAFVGVSAGIWAHQTGAGIVGAVVIGAVAGVGLSTLVAEFQGANWWWVVAAVLTAVGIYVGQAFAVQGANVGPLPFVPVQAKAQRCWNSEPTATKGTP